MSQLQRDSRGVKVFVLHPTDAGSNTEHYQGLHLSPEPEIVRVTGAVQNLASNNCDIHKYTCQAFCKALFSSWQHFTPEEAGRIIKSLRKSTQQGHGKLSFIADLPTNSMQASHEPQTLRPIPVPSTMEGKAAGKLKALSNRFC